MIKRILVAYDHGFKAQKALEIATEIAKGRNAEVYIFTSVKMPGIIDTYAARDMLKELENQSYSYFEKILEDAAASVRKEGVTAHVVIKNESPGEAISRATLGFSASTSAFIQSLNSYLSPILIYYC
jgi:nucleotide-binding universal stress UspA family protein